MTGSWARRGVLLWGALFALLVGTLFFLRAGELPLPHGDERAFLDVPYRFSAFGDFQYPVFMSESFGAAELRPYPPINALALRSLGVRFFAGFSARNSRYFSGVLILFVILAAWAWLQSRFDVPSHLILLALAPLALAPMVVIAARSTRLEQETFFFGALSALLLASGGMRGLTSSAWQLWVSGGLAAMAAGIHPFGVVYGGLAAICLIAVRRGANLVVWLIGAALGSVPTVWWMVAKGKNLVAFSEANAAIAQAREKDLSAWMAQFESVSWLRPQGLSESLLARFASLQESAFSEYSGFPVEPGLFSQVLRGLFWVEVLLVAGFLLRHLWARRVEDDGVAWFSLLALGFLVFTFLYVPNTTFGLYGGFHVHLAFVSLCLVEREKGTVFRRYALTVVGLAFLSFGLLSAQRLLAAPKTPTLDAELEAIQAVARASGIRPTDAVMTSTETWIAAGPRNASLLERIQYGLGSGGHDALAYRRSYVEATLSSGLPAGKELREKALKERTIAFEGTLRGLSLSGLLILDQATKDAVYFFRRGALDTVVVASIDPKGVVPIRLVRYGSDDAPWPRVECDSQPLPLCTFHEH